MLINIVIAISSNVRTFIYDQALRTMKIRISKWGAGCNKKDQKIRKKMSKDKGGGDGHVNRSMEREDNTVLQVRQVHLQT